MIVGNNETTTQQKMQANHWRFQLSWRCSGTAWGASSDGAHPGLHSKPWMLPLVECMCRIAPAAAIVDELKWNTQNTTKKILLVSNYGTFWSLIVDENFGTQKDPLLSSLMRQTLFKWWNATIGPEELAEIFLAIKRCQRTKSKKVIKSSWSSLKKLVHMCAIRG